MALLKFKDCESWRVAYHKPHELKSELAELLGEARKMSDRLGRLIDEPRNYDLVRQLKKVDAELLDVQHNLKLAIELQEKNHG